MTGRIRPTDQLFPAHMMNLRFLPTIGRSTPTSAALGRSWVPAHSQQLAHGPSRGALSNNSSALLALGPSRVCLSQTLCNSAPPLGRAPPGFNPLRRETSRRALATVATSQGTQKIGDPKVLLLVDGHSVSYRSFWALAKSREGGLMTTTGIPTSITTGVMKTVYSAITLCKPTAMAVVFDCGRSLRHLISALFAVLREQHAVPDEELIQLCKRLHKLQVNGESEASESAQELVSSRRGQLNQLIQSFFNVDTHKRHPDDPSEHGVKISPMSRLMVAEVLAKFPKDLWPYVRSDEYSGGEEEEVVGMAEAYPSEYKAGRAKTPEEFSVDLANLKRLLSSMQIGTVSMDLMEGDDMLAALAADGTAEGFQVVVLTGDKDLLQLVDDKTNVQVWYLDGGYGKLGRTTPWAVQDEASVEEKLGVRPSQVADFKAMIGDASDGLSGIPGVGQKTAIKLLLEHGPTLDDVYANLDSLKEPMKKKLLAGKVDAYYTLCMVSLGSWLPSDSGDICANGQLLNGFDRAKVNEVLDELEMKSFEGMIDRLQLILAGHPPEGHKEPAPPTSSTPSSSSTSPPPSSTSANVIVANDKPAPTLKGAGLASLTVEYCTSAAGLAHEVELCKSEAAAGHITADHPLFLQLHFASNRTSVPKAKKPRKSSESTAESSKSTDRVKAATIPRLDAGAEGVQGYRETELLDVLDGFEGISLAWTTSSSQTSSTGRDMRVVYVPCGMGSEAGHLTVRSALTEEELLLKLLQDPHIPKTVHGAKTWHKLMALVSESGADQKQQQVAWSSFGMDTLMGAYVLDPDSVMRGSTSKSASSANLGPGRLPGSTVGDVCQALGVQTLQDLDGSQFTSNLEVASPDISHADCGRIAAAGLHLHQLHAELLQQFRSVSAVGAYKLTTEVEVPLQAVLAGMELAGVQVDTQVLLKLGQEVEEMIRNVEVACHALLPDDGPEPPGQQKEGGLSSPLKSRAAASALSLSSPKQLSRLLFEVLQLPTEKTRPTNNGYSTDTKVLDSLKDDHPIVPLIIQYKELSKVKSDEAKAQQEEMLQQCQGMVPEWHQMSSTSTPSPSASALKAATSASPVIPNLGSPKQLSQLLFGTLQLPTKGVARTGSGGWSTNADSLEKLRHKHPIVPLILEHRELTKLKGGFVDQLTGLVDPHTSRLHTSYSQIGSLTGRLSSTRPNLQNIPTKRALARTLRSAFVPQEGWSLLSADYSQMELRILAHISQDPALMEAYKLGKDVHEVTARRIFNIKPDEAVAPNLRNAAKSVNFSVIYGQGARALKQDIGFSVAEAQDLIQGFFEAYPGVATYMEETRVQAVTRGFVETMFGRRRHFRFGSSALSSLLGNEFPVGMKVVPLLDREASSSSAFDSHLLRAAGNAPIQGTSADILKRAMVAINQELANRNSHSRILLSVHDELILEVHPEETDEVREIVVSCMEAAGGPDMCVPLQVDVSQGSSWAEL